jgi:hypothetical protein
MVGFRGEKLMKRPKDVTLKDQGNAVTKAKISSNKKEIDALAEEYGNRLLGRKEESTSIPAISGGRPESNRRKF